MVKARRRGTNSFRRVPLRRSRLAETIGGVYPEGFGGPTLHAPAGVPEQVEADGQVERTAPDRRGVGGPPSAALALEPDRGDPGRRRQTPRPAVAFEPDGQGEEGVDICGWHLQSMAGCR